MALEMTLNSGGQRMSQTGERTQAGEGAEHPGLGVSWRLDGSWGKKDGYAVVCGGRGCDEQGAWVWVEGDAPSAQEPVSRSDGASGRRV